MNMPYYYHTNADLPRSVQTKFLEHAQTTFRKTFNEALMHHNNQTAAFKIAWEIAEKEKKK